MASLKASATTTIAIDINVAWSARLSVCHSCALS